MPTLNNKTLNHRFIQLFTIANIIFWTVSCLLFYQVDVLNNNIEQGGDGPSYVIASKWLYEDNLWASAVRPFFYPLLIGLPKIFHFEINRLFTFLLNYIFWNSTTFLLYFFIKSYIKEQLAFIFAFFFASCFGLYSLAFMSTPENCFTLFLLIHIVFLQKFLINNKKENLFICTTFLALSFVVRPTLIPILPLTIVALPLLLYQRGINFKTLLVSLSLLLSIPSLQILNMKRCYGHYSMTFISHEVWYFFSGSYSFNKPNISNFNKQYYADAWHQLYRSRVTNYQKFTKDTTIWNQFISKAKKDFQEQLKNNKTSIIFTLFRDFVSNSVAGTPEIKEATNRKDYLFFFTYQKVFYTISQVQNIINSFFITFLCPFIFILFRKNLSILPLNQLIAMVYTWFIAFCIIVLSSFSFTQGDRFHIVTVPLSLVITSFLYCAYFHKKLKTDILNTR